MLRGFVEMAGAIARVLAIFLYQPMIVSLSLSLGNVFMYVLTYHETLQHRTLDTQCCHFRILDTDLTSIARF